MDSPVYQGVMLILMLIAFIGIWVWAWSHKRKEVFDQASRLPLEEDEDAGPAHEEHRK